MPRIKWIQLGFFSAVTFFNSAQHINIYGKMMCYLGVTVFSQAIYHVYITFHLYNVKPLFRCSNMLTDLCSGNPQNSIF